jgi:hypothetical protein
MATPAGPLRFDIASAVPQSSALPFERLRLVHHFRTLRLAQIRCGLIYFFAGWGPISMQGFRLVTRALASIDTQGLEVIVVDIDSVPPDFLMATFGHAHPAGMGETIWVRNGRIVAALETYIAGVLEPGIVARTHSLLHPAAG